MLARSQEAAATFEAAEIAAEWYADPPKMAREVFPEWFPQPMPWFHRGILAILLRQTDFLLNFGDELWGEGPSAVHSRWTKKKLAKLVRLFRTPIDPGDLSPKAPSRPIFRVRYGADGRTPVAVDLEIKRFTGLVIPRGFSKTTLVNFANLFKAVFKETKFTVYTSRSERHASDQLVTLRNQLESNVRLLAVFGNISSGKQDREKWNDLQIETKSGVRFTVRGAMAQIRGLSKDAVRPDCIIVDDAETKDTARSEEQTKKMIDWLFNDVLWALPRDDSIGTITVLGTLLGPSTMLARVMMDPEFTVVRLGAIDREGDPIWPWAMSKEKFERQRSIAAKRGQLYEFYLEIMSELRHARDAKFRGPFVHRAQIRDDFVDVALALDPAISKKDKACPSALAVVGRTSRGFLHVLDYYQEQGMSPGAQIDKYFELHFQWKPTRHGVELVAYQAALKYLLMEEMSRRARTMGPSAFFEIDDTYSGNQIRKEVRVEGILSPRYNSGIITHQRPFPELESQLLNWGMAGSFKDGPDVVAMAVALLEPTSALALNGAGEEEGATLTRDFYQPLEFEFEGEVP